MTQNLKLLSPSTNYAVVQMPGRNFPGVIIQGDTLHALVQRFNEMQNLVKIGNYEELADEIEYIKEELTEALENYEATCSKYRIELPYPQSE